MAGDEDEAQQVVADVVVERRIDRFDRVRGGDLVPDREFAARAPRACLQQLAAAQPVDRAVLGRRHEPGAGIVRHAGDRPLLERRHQRVLGKLLGHADVAHHARERRR